MKRWAGILALAAFVACVVVANYAVTHWGTPPAFPGGPHTVTILGLTAPSAVLIVGVSFTMRDVAQQFVGKWWVAVGILVGAALSAITASPGLALASCVGFAASEALDLAVYTPLAERKQWVAALAASNTVGSAIDSFLFLTIAFGWAALHTFFWPQFWLKALMTVPAILVLAPWRLRAVLARHGQAEVAR
jgi:uncharacterized PurR-regulated membrane protein YhhQ (DUF165 family)